MRARSDFSRIVAALLVFCGTTGYSSASEGLQIVDFCTVVRSPAKYDGRAISTSGILLPGEHSLSFYDPVCRPSKANNVNAQGVLEASATPAKLLRKLQGLLTHQHAARVRVEGVFYSTGGPFGADLARFRFAVQKIDSADKQ
jgi:hypothetical protein